MREIPQKGWYILRTEKELAQVYLDGKMIGGIQKASLELSATLPFARITLEIIPFDGLIIDTTFGPLGVSNLALNQEETIFRSSQTPEEILKALEIQEKETIKVP